MRAQLLEAVAALNRLGIVPLLLKGAVPLLLSQANQISVRMTSDLDLNVDAADEAGAQECALANLGLPLADARGIARPQDVGVLELRRTRESEIWLSTLVEWDRLRANIPSLPSRALHWIVHDLFKEGDYWRGRIDLRHLQDFAQLAEGDDVDWTSLRAAMPNQAAATPLMLGSLPCPISLG